jgi:DNA-binding Lrp family transcriptional regulator
MDELDSALVQLLQQDARQTNQQLARALGVAPSTCLERVRSLRERGVVLGYHADISLTALNREVQALISVQVRPLSRDVINSFKEYISDQREVVGLFVLAGGDDFLVHVAVPGVEALHTFLMEQVSKRREVVGFRSSIVYEHSRTTVLEALGERGQDRGRARARRSVGSG